MNIFDEKNQSCKISRYCTFKGIVQQDLTGVKTRLKRSLEINHLVTYVFFFILKEHQCEITKKPVSAS
jgi:hypothetical protein